jgi:hypothetical protein
MRDMNFSNDTDLVPVPVNATEITYIYHLIADHKVKGLTKSAYLFAQILRRIGDISKVFNYYDTAGKNLNGDIIYMGSDDRFIDWNSIYLNYGYDNYYYNNNNNNNKNNNYNNN